MFSGAIIKGLHRLRGAPGAFSSPSQTESPSLMGFFFTHTWKVWLVWGPSSVLHVSLIRTSLPTSEWGASHVAGSLSGRQWSRTWGFGLPNLTASSAEAERQDGLGALPVTSISVPDTPGQRPQTDFGYWFWLTGSDDIRALHRSTS